MLFVFLLGRNCCVLRPCERKLSMFSPKNYVCVQNVYNSTFPITIFFLMINEWEWYCWIWAPRSYLLHPAGPSCLAAGMPGGGYGELGSGTPAITSLNASFSTSMSIPSPYLFVPPAERKAISDVRRTFCLFVTFDLLFISLLWIIELNVSVLILFILLWAVNSQWNKRSQCTTNKSWRPLICPNFSDMMQFVVCV